MKTCPHCGEELHVMGTHFKAPKRSDHKAWEAIEKLYAAGVRYDVFDWHRHYWTEKYKEFGMSFEKFLLGQIMGEFGYLKQVLSEIGIKLPKSETGDLDERSRTAVPKSHFRPHENQWRGPRPSHPREVPAFLKWWREQNLDRIAMAVEICERLGYEPPEGLRGELLLEEIRKRFGREQI
jgi:hypothetical protein